VVTQVDLQRSRINGWEDKVNISARDISVS
jgi:hypothetical protein